MWLHNILAMFAASSTYVSSPCVVCPIHGAESGMGVHLGKPQWHSGDDAYEAALVYGIGVRGDVVVLPFTCESGCKWVLVFGFHKGGIKARMLVTELRDGDEED